MSQLTENDIARFQAKIGPLQADGCRLWTAAGRGHGYGMFNVRGRVMGAHRVAYQIAYGAPPEGLCVCHRCDTRACVNPEHLFLGTQADNMADMVAKGRRAIPPRGVEVAVARLNDQQVREIRKASGIGPRALGRRYGVSHTTIMDIRAGRRWRHVA